MNNLNLQALAHNKIGSGNGTYLLNPLRDAIYIDACNHGCQERAKALPTHYTSDGEVWATITCDNPAVVAEIRQVYASLIRPDFQFN